MRLNIKDLKCILKETEALKDPYELYGMDKSGVSAH